MITDNSKQIKHHNLRKEVILSNTLSLHKVSIEGYDNQNIEELYQYYAIQIPNRIIQAAKKRKLEFLIGRLALRSALNAQGIKYFNLVNDKLGAPIWPKPLHGSLSHTIDNSFFGSAIATINITNQHVGIDIEFKKNQLLFNQQPNMINQFLNSLEIKNIEVFSPISSLLYLIIFSAKESIIKAVYSKYGKILNFLEIQLMDYCKENKRLYFEINLSNLVLKIEVHYLILSLEIITYCMVT